MKVGARPEAEVDGGAHGVRSIRDVETSPVDGKAVALVIGVEQVGSGLGLGEVVVDRIVCVHEAVELELIVPLDFGRGRCSRRRGRCSRGGHGCRCGAAGAGAGEAAGAAAGAVVGVAAGGVVGAAGAAGCARATFVTKTEVEAKSTVQPCFHILKFPSSRRARLSRPSYVEPA